MKFLNLLILALCFCACATSQNIRNIDGQTKKIPVFMSGTKQRTALKTMLEADKKIYNFLLLANKKDGYINFKIIGDFAAVLASVNLRGAAFEYESSSPILTDQKAKQAFEEILLALFAPNALDKHKYYFKKGESLPYKLKQKSEVADKTFLFKNYDGNIPQNITVTTKFNIVKVSFELLAHD